MGRWLVVPLLLALAACGAGPQDRLTRIVDATAQPVRVPVTAPPRRAPDLVDLPPPDRPMDFEDFYNRVRAHAPDLEALRAEARAALARVGGAGAWMDPRVSADLAPQSIGGMRTGYGVQVSQDIPWPQRQGADRDASLAEATMAVADLQVAERHHLVEARAAYAEYWMNTRRGELYDREIAILDAAIAATEARLADGSAMVLGMAEARAMRAEVARMRSMAHRDREVMGAAMMRAMMGLPGDAAIPEPGGLIAVDLSIIPDQADLLEVGRSRPEVARAQAALDLAQARRRDAQANGLPDWEVMAGYTTMEEDRDMRFTLGVGVSVPVQRAPRDAARESAAQGQRAAEARLRQALAEADHEIVAAVARLRDHAEAVRLLEEEELPATAAAVAAAEAALASGMGGLGEVVAARRRHLDAQQRLVFEQHEWFHWLGELECCIGMRTLDSMDGQP